MTPTERALPIVRDEGPIRPMFFAQLMWPDSPSWHSHSNIGNGATTGVGIWRKAGSYLAQLKRRELVTWSFLDFSAYVLTRDGLAWLNGQTPRQPDPDPTPEPGTE